MISFPKRHNSLCFLFFFSCFTAASAQTLEIQNQVPSQNTTQAVKKDIAPPNPEKTSISPAYLSASMPKLLIPPISKNEAMAVNPPKVDAGALTHLSIDRAIDLLIRNNLSVIAAGYNVDLAKA